MNIIGLSGLAGSGKNAISDILEKHHSYVTIGLADPIKRLTQQVYRFSEEQLFGPSQMRNEIDERYGIPPRKAITVYGTAGRECYPNTWIDKAKEAIQVLEEEPYSYYKQSLGIYHTFEKPRVEGVTISDLRYKNEMLAFREIGGKIVRVIREGAGLYGEAGQHSSEQEQLSLPDSFFDYVFYNDVGLELLGGKVGEMVRDLFQ